MAAHTVKFKVNLPFWWKPYLYAVVGLAWLRRRGPDYAAAIDTIVKHTAFTVVSEP